MYIKAFATFGAGSVGSLKEVHFLDLNDDILALVRDAHKKWAGKIDKLDFKVAWQYDKQAAAAASGGGGGGRGGTNSGARKTTTSLNTCMYKSLLKITCCIASCFMKYQVTMVELVVCRHVINHENIKRTCFVESN